MTWGSIPTTVASRARMSVSRKNSQEVISMPNSSSHCRSLNSMPSVIAAVLSFGALSDHAAAQAVNNSPIVIGIPQTLSGPASNFGKDDQIAYTMALEDVNKAGGIKGRP